MHDTGIMQIRRPNERHVVQNSESYVMVTGTVMDYGLRDWNALPVHIQITGPAGFTTIDSTFAYVTFTVPRSKARRGFISSI